MALLPEDNARLEDERDCLPEEAKELRRNFARLMLKKLDAQITRGRITNAPRKDTHGFLPEHR